MSINTDEEINLIKGSCALCQSTIYGDESGYIEYHGGLFCTVSCAQEATGDEIKTGTQFINGYLCPYCLRINEINDRKCCSVALENGTIMITCAHCEKESISDLKVDDEPTKKSGKQYQIVIEGSNYKEVYDLFEEIQNKYSLYDNCVFQEVNTDDTIVDSDRTEETGILSWEPSGDIKG